MKRWKKSLCTNDERRQFTTFSFALRLYRKLSAKKFKKIMFSCTHKTRKSLWMTFWFSCRLVWMPKTLNKQKNDCNYSHNKSCAALHCNLIVPFLIAFIFDLMLVLVREFTHNETMKCKFICFRLFDAVCVASMNILSPHNEWELIPNISFPRHRFHNRFEMIFFVSNVVFAGESCAFNIYSLFAQ